jgi:M6 family metalloprotease-like protein
VRGGDAEEVVMRGSSFQHHAKNQARDSVLSRLVPPVIIVGAIAVLVWSLPAFADSSLGLEGSLEGVITLVWGDGPPEAPISVGPIVRLADASGRTVELLFDEKDAEPLGGLRALSGRRVAVHGTWIQKEAPGGARLVLEVDSLILVDLEEPSAISALTGSHPWVSLMCKFSDKAAEPKPLSYFQNMFANSYPGLDHYWRELSYDHANVAGSTAAGWVTLPQPQSYYVPTPGSGCPPGNANLNALFIDCTAAADPIVDFSNGGNPFAGINLMFNDLLDGCAWGGWSPWVTLDGVSKSWRATWEPPWGYAWVAVISHEMGHGFGLPHSCFNPAVTYDNTWDVMSDIQTFTVTDPTYGRVAQHTISHHKDTILGWLRAPEAVTVGANASTTVVLERLGRPTEPGPKMVKIPIGGSATHFYTVEARRRAGYDMSTTTDAVIIHDVNTLRVNGIDAYVQGTNGGAGATWIPGQLFRDVANNIGVAVIANVGNGFQVAVASGSAMAASNPGVDAASGGGSSSNVNSVFEPGETILFQPTWTNVSTGGLGPTGTLSGFTGPGGATYTVPDGTATYSFAPPVGTTGCLGTGDCYLLQVSNPPSRPALHWDTTVTETLSSGATKTWPLHIGSSFTDVGTGHWAYSFVESLLHSGITAGCGGSFFCPGNAITRWQMAPFLAKGLTGGSIPTTGWVEGLGTYNCVSGGTSLFSDVAPGNPACKAIHYIASRKITSGCTPSAYCPGNTVNRWQMAVFLAKTMAGKGVPVSGTVPGKGAYNCVAGRREGGDVGLWGDALLSVEQRHP